MTNQPASAHPPIDLAGAWTAALDPERRGEREAWFAAPLPGAAPLRLPGSAQAQGLGEAPDLHTEWVGGAVDHEFYRDERYAPYREPGALKVPFLLQPERVHVGEVWYQRTVSVPHGGDYELLLERVHWESTVWIDDQRIGSERSLSTAHRFRIDGLAAGEHRLTIRVDNAMIVDVGTNAHSVTDHTQGGWNGIIGEMSLTRIAPARVEALAVHPHLATRTARVRCTVVADSLDGIDGTLTLTARPVHDGPAVSPVVVPIAIEAERFRRGRAASGSHLDVDVPLGDDARAWDEFDPARYELEAVLEATTAAGASVHRRTTVFGLREVEVVGTRVHVNGRPVFLRGALECCVFPLTGYPPTDEASWARILETCRAYGLNHLRFHSWCPPEAAFAAADAAGVYLQVEGPVWANQGAAIGVGRDVDAYLHDETRRILEAYGDHPSFLLMAHGNEPAGRDAEFLADWVEHWRRRDPRRLYTSAAGWPSIDASDFDCVPEPRLHRWDEGLGSRLNATPPETRSDYADYVTAVPRPILTHEAGQWCVHPNLDEIAKYTGVMRPRSFEIVRDFLAESELLDHAADFVHASGRLQVLCYKEEVEAALRTPGFGGIQLLGISDFPGQGTAPVGVLDAFWQPKPYVDAAEFHRFFSATVPLALLDQRTWSTAETLRAEVRIAHFGAAPFTASLDWRLEDEQGASVLAGSMGDVDVALGNERDYGVVEVPLQAIERAQRMRLVLSLRTADGAIENHWDQWVYPPLELAPAEDAMLVTRDVDEALVALGDGRTVLLVPQSGDAASPVELGFTTVFWNTSWTRGQAPHTLGVLCDPAHPALEGFPTDAHTDWEWWELLQQARALDLTALGAAARPVVQVIDSWFDARRLGLVLEASVGTGRLLLSTIDVVTDLDRRLVARRLRASLDRYLREVLVESPLELTPGQLRRTLAGEL